MAVDSISLLTSINGTLNSILKVVSPQNRTNTESTRQAIIRENRGGLDPSVMSAPKAQKDNGFSINSGKADFKELVTVLSTIPEPIKKIAGLNNKVLKNFTNVINSIIDTVTTASDKLSDTQKINNLKSISDITVNLSNGIDSISKIGVKIPFATLSIKMLKPFFKALANVFNDIKVDNKNLQPAIDTLKVLTDISKNGLKIKITKSDINAVKKLKPFFNALVESMSVLTVSDKDGKNTANAVEVIKSLSALSDSIKKIAKVLPIIPFATLSVKLMKPFFKTIGEICQSMSDIKGIDKGIENVKKLNIFANTIIKFAAVGVGLVAASLGIGLLIKNKIKDIAIGFAGITSVLLGYAAVAKLAAKIGKNIVSNQIWIKQIAAFALLGVGLLVVSAAVGALAPKYIPEITAGFIAVSAAMIGYAAVSAIASIAAKHVTIGFAQIKIISLFALTSVGLLIVSAATGVLVQKYFPETIMGIAGIVVTMGLIVGMSHVIALASDKSMSTIKYLAGVEALFLGAAALVFVSAVFGGFVKQTWGYVIEGITAITSMMFLIVKMGGVIAKTAKASKSAIKNLALVEALFLGSSALLFVGALMGAFISQTWKYVLFGIASMSAMMSEMIGLSIWISKASKASKTAIKNIALVEALFISSSVLLFVGAVMGAFISQTWKYVLLGIISMSAMMGLIIGLSAVIKTASKASKTAVVNLLLVEAVFAGSAVVLAAAIGVAKLIQVSGVTFVDILETIAAISTIVLATSALTSIVNKAKTTLIQGAIGMFAVEGVIAGLAAIVTGLVGINILKNKNNIDWKDIFITLGVMGTIIAGVGGLAVAATALIVPLTIGAGVLTVIIATTALLGLVTLELVGIKKVLDNNKYTTSDIGDTLKGITGIFTLDNLDIKMSLLDIAKLDAKFLALIPIIGTLGLATVIVGKMVNTLGTMDDNGKVRPVLSIDDNGNAIYGKPVDIYNVTKVITSCITHFATELSNTFKDFDAKSMLRINAAMLTLRNMIMPVSKFTEMLMAFQDAGDGKLRTVQYDSNGNLLNTPIIEVAKVSKTIASAISAFSDTLFSDANINGWMKNITKTSSKWPFSKSDASKAMGVLGNIIMPISNFVNVLKGFQSGGTDVLKVDEYDASGKKIGTKEIQIVAVADTIATAVTTFAKTLFSDKNASVWSDIVSGNDGKFLGFIGKNNKQKGIGAFAMIIDPIANFIDVLKGFSGVGGQLTVTDSEGKEKTVNVVFAATKIATAVTTFVTKISKAFDKDKIDALNKNTGIAVNSMTKITSAYADMSKGLETFNPELIDTFSEKIDSLFNISTKLPEFLLTFGAASDGFSKNFEIASTALQAAGKQVKINVDQFKTLEKQLSNISKALQKSGNNIKSNTEYFKSLNSQIIGVGSTLESMSYPDEVKLNSITSLGKNIATMMATISESATANRVKKIDTFTKSVNASSSGMKDFDSIIERGKNARKKNLEEFGNVVDALSTKLNKVNTDLKNFKDVLNIVTNADVGKIDKVSTALSTMADSVSSASRGGSLSKKSLIEGIQEALEGVSLTSDIAPTPSAPAAINFEDANNPVVKAIAALIDNMNNNTMISTTIEVDKTKNNG